MTRLSVIIKAKESISNIDECIDSVCSYMGKDLEVFILAGEKTEDKSDLLLKYSEKDKRIKIFYENRDELNDNILNHLAGKYTVVLDACDCLEKNSLSKVMSVIGKSESDIIMFNYSIMHSDKTLKKFKCLFDDMSEFNGIKDEKMMSKIIMPNNFHIFRSVLLRTEFIKNIKLDLHKKNSVTEELESTLYVFDNAETILIRDINLLVYRVKAYNEVSDFSYDSFNTFAKYYEIQLRYLKKWLAPDSIMSDVYKYQFIVVSQMFFEAFKLFGNSNDVFSNLKPILKSDWVKGIISNVKSDLLDDEQKKRLKAFKIGKVRMIWLLYKLNK